MFKPVSSQVDFPALEEEILNFWEENNTFEKSIESRPADKKWNFLDGPPFVTGTPHYGSLLSSIPKDIFGRFFTMKGYRVRRVWGWDGHGLPIENKVETALGIKSKKEIEEKVGVKKFIEECLKYVDDVSADWEWYVDHIGRWVDFKNAYKTWDLPYMESVMWVFKQIYEKGLIYKGFRVILFCPHCSTPISNFEVAMDAENYRDVTEAANTYKYKLADMDVYLLGWSTTPWTKLVTTALAVNPNLDYVQVSQGDEHYVLAKSRLEMLKPEPKYEIEKEFKGKDLVGRKFEPHYSFSKIDEGKKAYEIIAGDFVTEEEGTGVVTIAAYGEEDLKVMNEENIQVALHLDEEGNIYENVPKFGGMYYLKANKEINKDLEERGLMYDEKQLTHSMPHCWRCGTRLYYAPKDAWYINIKELKPELFKNNEPINWFPKHFKEGRFKKSIEAAPDWNISRNRYWGSPVPVWECECGEKVVPGSVEELEELSGQKITNLHKPEIDEVSIDCPKCGKKMKRTPEVLDSWMEAGSAAFAERHFPFSGEKKEDFFPPDFIAEYTGQIRAWFYVLHVIGTAIYDSPAFKNVLVEGVLLGNDGRKMSKNYGNYPDPKELMQKYGGDALRLYLIGSSVMKGEDVSFENDGVPKVTRGFLLILWNSYKFFVDYATLHKWNPDINRGEPEILDKWILARLNQLILQVSESLEKYDAYTSSRAIEDFVVNDFSTWYIRRSRDRVGFEADESDRNTCLSIMYEVLVTLSKLLAPFTPFIAEEMYRNLTNEESVHLSDYPLGNQGLVDEDLIKEMVDVRKAAELGHAQRKEANIKLRQPLNSLATTYQFTPDFVKVLSNEVNVKSIEQIKSSTGEPKVQLDTNITPELQEEGDARDLMRQIQQLRKDQNLTLADKTEIIAPNWPEKFEKEIIAGTASVSISKGPELKVTKVA